MKKILTPLLGVAAFGVSTATWAAEDCSAFPNHCKVVYIEAEDFNPAQRETFDINASPLRPGWVNTPAEILPPGITLPDNLVDPSTAATRTPDPDESHASDASGGAYLELLPDTFTDKAIDEKIDGVNFWQNGGDGPKVAYTVNFPEAGRYHVYVRANKTGSEDNGIHLGLNGTWPASGAQMQWCGTKNKWQWRGRQRNSGNYPPEGQEGHNSCGIDDTIWLDIPTAGAHTVWFSGREDGFEMDRIAFVKNLKPLERMCRPVYYEPARMDCSKPWRDLMLEAHSSVTQLEIGQTTELIYTLRNNSEAGKITRIRAYVTLPDELEFVSSTSGCFKNNSDKIECHIDSGISEGTHRSHRMLVRAAQLGTGQVTSDTKLLDQNDYNNNNHKPALDMTVVKQPILADARVELSASVSSLKVNESVTLTADVSNQSPDQALQSVVLTQALGSAFEFVAADDACTLQGQSVRCTWASISTSATKQVNWVLKAKTEGSQTLSANVSASADANGANNTAQVALSVSPADSVAPPPTEPKPTPTPEPQPPTTNPPSSGGGGGGGAMNLWWLVLTLLPLGLRRKV